MFQSMSECAVQRKLDFIILLSHKTSQLVNILSVWVIYWSHIKLFWGIDIYKQLPHYAFLKLQMLCCLNAGVTDYTS